MVCMSKKKTHNSTARHKALQITKQKFCNIKSTLAICALN